MHPPHRIEPRPLNKGKVRIRPKGQAFPCQIMPCVGGATRLNKKVVIRLESSERWRNQVLCRHTPSPGGDWVGCHRKASPPWSTCPLRGAVLPPPKRARFAHDQPNDPKCESRFLAMAGPLIHRPTPGGCGAVPPGWRAVARSSAAEARAAQSGNSDQVARVQHDAIARLERQRVNGTRAE